MIIIFPWFVLEVMQVLWLETSITLLWKWGLFWYGSVSWASLIAWKRFILASSKRLLCWILLLNFLSKGVYCAFQSLAQQYSSEFLQSELERTRINTACFAESIPLDSVPEPAKSAYSPYRNSMDSPSKSHRGTHSTGSSSFSRHRYWWA